MYFKNRSEAATQLAARLVAYKGQNPLVLGVPRGAVPMARIIADALGGELDVVLVRKLRAQGRARREMYTKAPKASDPAGRIVVIVDAGIATGSSMLAAIRLVRTRKPRKLVVAVGVAPPRSLASIEAEADEVVCLYSPADFYAVGQFFEDFTEVTDEMVVTALSRAARAA